MERKVNLDILENLIAQSGLPVYRIAEDSGIGGSTLNKILRHNYPPSVDAMWALADYFAVPLDFLVGRLSKEETEKIQENFQENWKLLQRSTYERQIVHKKAAYLQPIPPGYEAPWPYNLLDDIFDQPFTWVLTNDQEAGVNAAIERLSQREQQVLGAIYRDGQTLSQIGLIYRVTPERIRQIHKKAIRKLRAPVNRQLIEDGLEGSKTIREERTYISNRKRELIKERIELKKAEENGQPFNSDPFAQPFEEVIEPSIRVFNCLKRAHINTIYEIIESFKTGDIWKIRNLGRKSIEELMTSLGKFGIRFTYNNDNTWNVECDLKEEQSNA